MVIFIWIRITNLLLGFAWLAHGLASEPVCVSGVSSLSTWPNCGILHNSTSSVMELFWRLAGNLDGSNGGVTHAEFKIVAKGPASWYAIGFSSNGGMKGADIALLRVQGQTLTIEDRYAEDQERPFMDQQQDWELVEGSVESGVIDAVIRRRLRTCDPFDIEIFSDAPQTMIYALGPGSSDIMYHGPEFRGIKELSFTSSAAAKTYPSYLPTGEIPDVTFDLLMHTDGAEKVQIPVDSNSTRTTASNQYLCSYFNLDSMMPNLQEQARHIIAVEPVIDMAHVAHHMILYGCPTEPKNTKTSFQCLDMATECQDIIWVWAVGASSIHIPHETGLRIGGPGGVIWARLEMHYYNPMLIPNLVDASGYRITTTSALRPFDLGVWLDGPAMLMLPPFTENAKAESFCPGGCSKAWSNESLTVVGVGYHMHGHGKALELSVIRDGKNIGPISRQPLYDYNHQTIIPAQMLKTLKRGDGFHISCAWDTTKKQYYSFWGDGTDDEMCITVVWYYPKQYQNSGGSLAACQFSEDNALNKQTQSSSMPWWGSGNKPAVPGIRGWVDNRSLTPTQAAQEVCNACKGTDDEFLQLQPEMDLCGKCKTISVDGYRPAEVARLLGAGGACQALVTEGHCPSCVTTECPEGEVARFLLSRKPEICAPNGPVCSLAENTADVTACYSVTAQIRNGKDGFRGVGFHPSDRLAIMHKPPDRTDALDTCPPPKSVITDLCTKHGDCDTSEYCALSKPAPFLKQNIFPARRCEPCYRCCDRQDAVIETESTASFRSRSASLTSTESSAIMPGLSIQGRCPDKCKCEETVVSCQRKAEPSVYCVASKMCVPETSDADTVGCAACPDPRDVIFHKEQRACLPCEDNDDMFRRLISRLPGGMGNMLGDHCQESLCIIFRTMFGDADGGGGDMMKMLDTMLNSTCPAVCTPCAAMVEKRNVTYGVAALPTTSTSEPALENANPTSAAIRLSWLYSLAIAMFLAKYL